MISPTLRVVRRRFLVMLWLSVALHALVIGLTHLPSPLVVAPPRELEVQLPPAAPVQVATVLPRAEPDPGVPGPRPRQPQPLSQAQTQAATQLAPQPVPPAAAPSPQPAPATVAPAAPSHEAPGLQLDIPVLADSRYYTAKELDVQPSTLRRPEPVYPSQAEEQGVAGRVVIRLHLEADGSISKTEVVSVAPSGAFGELFRKATLDSLKSVRFRPAQRNGQPVRAVVEIPVVFEPDN